MEEGPLVNIKELSVAYRTDRGRLIAVDKLCLEIKQGEAVAVVGESGCGKSSLALGIMGLLNRKQVLVDGEIIFEKKNILGLSERRLQMIRGRRIAMVFQDPMTSLNPYLRIGTQVSEGIRHHLKCGNRGATRRAISMLNAVGLPMPEKQLNRYPHQFSGGMRQRAMLATALSCSPDLLIADEPTTALDVTIQAQILNLIRRELQRRKMSLLLITHDLGIVAGLCHRVFVMYGGKILEEANVESLYTQPCHPYTRALLKTIPCIEGENANEITPINGQPPDLINFVEKGCVFRPRCPFANERCATQIPMLRMDSRGRRHRCHYELPSEPSSAESHDLRLVNESSLVIPEGVTISQTGARVNRSINNHSANTGSSSKMIILRVEELVVQYSPSPERGSLYRSCLDAVKAVNRLSLHLEEGEILGLAGESGCGKSTLVRAILRLLEPIQGKIFFRGLDITRLTRRELLEVRRHIQLIFQDPYSSLNPRMKTWQLIAEPLINFKLSGNKQLRKKASELMDLVGLDPSWADRYPHEFSGGQRQRIGIARALAQQPKVILCDEPVSALDVSVQAQIINLLKDLRDRLNLSLIFISHDLAVLRQICDRVAIMYKGRIVESADANRIYSAPRHPYTKSLMDAIPIANPFAQKRQSYHVTQDHSSAANETEGCDFAIRCSKVKHRCRRMKPELEAGECEHLVACFYWDDHR